MKENENKKPVVRVTGEEQKETADLPQDGTRNKMEKLKKPLIFTLMGIVFIGCMYLIFTPSSDKGKPESAGLNDSVPGATGTGMPADKGKAYEQEMLRRKEQEKRGALLSLSDYWNGDGTADDQVALPDGNPKEGHARRTQRKGNPSLHSYRNAQSTLTSFYEEPDGQTRELRKELEELKGKLAENDVPKPVSMDEQLALMEKSYQMAAKYLPKGTNTGEAALADDTASGTPEPTQTGHVVAFRPARQHSVSALYRKPTDSTFLTGWGEKRNFYTAGVPRQVTESKNSIDACVHKTQTLVGETEVRLRLLEPAQTPGHIIPKGTLLTAHAKFRGGRLALQVTSIELDGNIIPVAISIYDLDGQQGLFIPYSPEMSALTEMAGNMGQASGTSVMLTQSAGQQAAADLGRGVVQGISGYFSKKVRTPKVTLKAGHRVFLVPKN